jgi:MerR family transcriptional regulator, heat shock protein HspR
LAGRNEEKETPMRIDATAPMFVISVAAELAEMHPQTLRQYDRLGIVSPSRAPGRSRRYSQRDVEMLREVQRLSQEGVSLEGIKRILELENQVAALRSRVTELTDELAASTEAQRRYRPDGSRVFAAGLAGEVITLARGQRPRPRSQALVVWRPQA